MFVLHTGDLVRLRAPTPPLWLPPGELGVVQQAFVGPAIACEVEFHRRGHCGTVCALVRPEQLDVLELRGQARRAPTRPTATPAMRMS